MADTSRQPEYESRRWRPGLRKAVPGSDSVLPFTPRLRHLFYLTLGLCGVAGAILAWLLIPTGFDEPVFVSIPVTEYDDRALPLNPWADQDSQLLLPFFERDKGEQGNKTVAGQPKRAWKVVSVQEKHQLLESLRELPDIAAPAVIIHLRMLAVAREGKVYLLPGNARLHQRDLWLGLEELLRAVGKGKQPNRLLLLDIMQPLMVPLVGELADDLSGLVKQAIEAEIKKSELSLQVICACSAGQTSQVSEELGASVFAYYLHQGLLGNADGYNPQNKKDQRITVKELADYVAKRVSRWCRLTRGIDQTPCLIGTGADFEIRSLAQQEVKPQKVRESESFKEWLRQAWEVRDTWRAEGRFQTQPLQLRSLESMIFRAEQRWRAGVGEEEIRKILRSRQDSLQNGLKPLNVYPPAERSLALAHAANRSPDLALNKQVEEMLDSLIKLKPEEIDKLKPELTKLLALGKEKPFQYAWACVESLKSPQRERVQALARYLLRPAPKAAEFAEARWLLGLAEFCEKRSKVELDALPPRTVPLAVNAIRRVEQAVLVDPRAFPWLSSQLTELLRGRQEAFRTLYEDRSRRSDAVKHLEQLDVECEALEIANRRLRQAFDLRLVTLETLPALVPYLVIRTGPEAAGIKDSWDKAREALLRLDQLLLTVDPGKVNEVEQQRLELQRHTGELQQLLHLERVEHLVKRASEEPTMASYFEMEALLATPGLSGPVRAQLWAAKYTVALKLHHIVAELDQEPKSSERPNAPLRAGLSVDALPHLRAELSLGLLRLTGFPGKLQDEYQERKEWIKLGEGLRDAWLEQVPRQFESPKLDPWTRDRLARLVLPTETLPSDPAWERERHERQTYRDWLETMHQGRVP